jgi:Raf kinase inhibitor-like YbhB/YbcL family protein
MRITTPAFHDGGRIPPDYTCDGDDVNPELRIVDVPDSAQSLAIMVDDPTSPSGNWLHWSVWNIDPSVTLIPRDSVPKGAIEGETDFSEVGYGGPCPSYGEHEYRFMVFALDTKLNIARGAPRHVVEEAMKLHIIAEAVVSAKYQRIKKEPRATKVAKNSLIGAR